MSEAAVWVSGVGAWTPLGNSLAEIGDALLAGRSAVTAVNRFDAAQHPSRVAAQVGPPGCPDGVDAAAFGRLPPIAQLAVRCCADALHSAGLWADRNSLRIGLVLGLGTEWMFAWESDGPGRMRDEHESAVELTRELLGLTGPTLTLSAACASGNYAIAAGRSWLRRGMADVCLAGGCELSVTPMTLAAFGNLRALSRRNDEPAAASRPFDRDRDGFVLGEGGTVCALEPAQAVRRRGGPTLAEVAGFGATSDAFHMVIPSPDTSAAEAAIGAALADAHVTPDGVDYVNAHGTGTPVGDATEVKALRSVFGPAADKVPISSTKSMTGHLLTAAAAFEALAGVVALERGAVPPTINLDNPDPECRLCHVRGAAQERPVRVVLSNSFGFGGSNTALVLRRAA